MTDFSQTAINVFNEADYFLAFLVVFGFFFILFEVWTVCYTIWVWLTSRKTGGALGLGANNK